MKIPWSKSPKLTPEQQKKSDEFSERYLKEHPPILILKGSIDRVRYSGRDDDVLSFRLLSEEGTASYHSTYIQRGPVARCLNDGDTVEIRLDMTHHYGDAPVLLSCEILEKQTVTA